MVTDHISCIAQVQVFVLYPLSFVLGTSGPDLGPEPELDNYKFTGLSLSTTSLVFFNYNTITI